MDRLSLQLTATVVIEVPATAAGVHRLRPVRARAQVLFELAAVQVVQHVQLNLFQVELKGGPGRAQQAPVNPAGLPLIPMGTSSGGEAVLHVPVLSAKIHLGLCRLPPPAGPVLVVGVVDGVLHPQTLGFLHVWTLLNQGHGLPGFSCRNTVGSGLSCASRLRSSLVQMMNAFRGLLTLCCVDTDLASGLAQLESEFTDSGLGGPELGERTSVICSPSTVPESSPSNGTLIAQSWYAAGSCPKCMFTDGDDVVALLRAAVILLRRDGYMRELRQWEAWRSGFKGKTGLLDFLWIR
ncbi:hypothetical protein EYF80_023947 [Liparis tanakae]|uniref:Uncharacterized protein n=1 Tax=Liparis tanakae TaxID=230148 RepID=A0A4Z2HKI1_9TELE|nr:hypothetical protein EYF80_023947 [Liparis tanakae]